MLTSLHRLFITMDNWMFRQPVWLRYTVLNLFPILVCSAISFLAPTGFTTDHRYLLGVLLAPLAGLVSSYHVNGHRGTDLQFIISMVVPGVIWIATSHALCWFLPNAIVLSGFFGWCMAFPFSWSGESRFLED